MISCEAHSECAAFRFADDCEHRVAVVQLVLMVERGVAREVLLDLFIVTLKQGLVPLAWLRHQVGLEHFVAGVHSADDLLLKLDDILVDGLEGPHLLV